MVSNFFLQFLQLFFTTNFFSNDQRKLYHPTNFFYQRQLATSRGPNVEHQQQRPAQSNVQRPVATNVRSTRNAQRALVATTNFFGQPNARCSNVTTFSGRPTYVARTSQLFHHAQRRPHRCRNVFCTKEGGMASLSTLLSSQSGARH